MFDGLIYDLFKEKKLKAKQGKLNYPHLLEKVQKQILPLLEYESNPKWILYRLGFQLRQFLNQNAKRQIFARFDDLILRLYNHIQDHDAKKSIESLFDVAVIDEFQDTDQVQFDLFYELFMKDQKIPIFLVGDPKQSIYGFRKADVYAFFKAKEQFKNEQIFELQTNFRSSFALTNALNHFFSMREDQNYLWLPKKKQTLPFTHVKSSQNEKNDSQALHFMVGKSQKGFENDLYRNIYFEMTQLLKKGYQFSGLCNSCQRSQSTRKHLHIFKKTQCASSVAKTRTAKKQSSFLALEIFFATHL